ncbi:RING-H2 finger protein ATL39 [Ricinus communis]|uniref:RING-H2 finger protein ATL39 n=1 Tax=Ricinus communis TaxID=3988 RepID=UPI00201A9823|nr:RING-H2 finger protein ATL39 [Ricinus communis]
MSNNNLGLAAEIIIMAIVVSVILLFVGIGLLVFIHACIIGRSFRNNDPANDPTGSTDSPGRTTSISADDLEKLPSFDFIAKSKGSSPVDCAVCLDNFRAGDKCRLLPICKHSFHAQCVDEWLLKTPICPICRASAGSRRGGVAIGEESSHLSDTSIDMRGNLTTDSSRHFSDDAGVELRGSNTTGSAQATINAGNELTQNQTDVIETTQLSSNP